MADENEMFGNSEYNPELPENWGENYDPSKPYNYKPQGQGVLGKVREGIPSGVLGAVAKVAIPAAALVSLDSCTKKDYVNDAFSIGEENHEFSASANADRFGVYYGKDATIPALKTFREGTLAYKVVGSADPLLVTEGGIVVQPAYISAQTAIDNGIAAFGYGSGISLYNSSTQTPEYQALYNTMLDNGWFLKDKNGSPLNDPTGSINGVLPQMVDIRIPAAREAMRAFLVDIGVRYPQGLQFDSPDAAAYVSTVVDPNGIRKDPSEYAGLSTAMGQLIKDVGTDIAMQTRKVLADNNGNPLKDAKGNIMYCYPKAVNIIGGFQQPPAAEGEPILEAAAQINCGITLEGKAWTNSTTPSNAADREWILGRLQVLAGKAKQIGRDGITINALEVTGPGHDHQKTMEETAKMYHDMRSQLPLPLKLRTYAADPDNAGYLQFDRQSDVEKNAALRDLKLVVKNEHLLQGAKDILGGSDAAKEMMAQTKSFQAKLEKGDGSFAKAIAADLKKGHAAQIKAQKAEAEANKDKGIA